MSPLSPTIQQRVLPYSDQQLSGTFGGPLRRDRIHFFGNYEYEREPRTSIWNTPYPEFNVALDGTNNKKLGGGRLDYQLSTQTRLMGKVTVGRVFEPFGLGNQQHPAATNTNAEKNHEALGQLTQVRQLVLVDLGGMGLGFGHAQ